MILFKTIRFKNFLSTGNQWTEIFLDRSKSTLIVGENGAGKSTVLDALSYVLFGKAFRKINKPQLVNSINNKNAEVEIEFITGSKHYLVKRGIKPSFFEIYCDNNLINQHADTKEYQDYFEKNILKLNHRSFSQIVILGNASFTPFMQLPAAHRREIIEDLLDIQIFTTMNILLKEKIALNRNSIIETEFELKLVQEKIEMHKKFIESIKQNNDDTIKQKQIKLDEIVNNLEIAKKVISDLSNEIQELSLKINEKDKVRSRKKVLVELESQVENKLRKIKKEIDFLEKHDNCPTCTQNIDHTFKEHATQSKLLDITKLNDGLQKLEQELVNIENKIIIIEVTESEISKLVTKLNTVNVDINTYNNLIQAFMKEIDELKHTNKHVDINDKDLNDYKNTFKSTQNIKDELVKDRGVLDVAALLLKDSGVKTKIIRQYIPIMNKLINKYLAAMDFFVNFELNENFEESIKSRYRDEFSYASFSEGEKMRIDLALLFTWRAISKLRNSASTNLLIMDEVFDSSLDANGTEEFLKIISALAGDTNIFIISHKGDQLYDKFHSVIKFEKHNNFSRIVKT